MFQLNQRVSFRGSRGFRVVQVLANAYIIRAENGVTFTVWPEELAADAEEPECTMRP